ncbi:hypothetical protein HPB48_012080 [Haemaphysalis longicornis]|uniref:Uncharacterized protein n=1 Tax=Haemaphysalis longicornis TaxID=44386 RepID=A0A9J6H4T9_HAELO|nr:hypothetical protein HPB48_012080 [Haemaphysalis longicornis]
MNPNQYVFSFLKLRKGSRGERIVIIIIVVVNGFIECTLEPFLLARILRACYPYCGDVYETAEQDPQELSNKRIHVADASKFLVESMEPLEEERQDVWLRRVLGWLESQRLEGPFLTKDQLLSCIREFQQADSDGTDSRLLLADAFSLVPLTYCQERRKFVPRKMAGHPLSPRLFGDAGAKAFFFRERYQLVLQKTARHQCFSSRLPGAAGFDLRPVEHLLGTRGDTVVVLGMICQLEEGKYFLEDPTGSVRIDTSGTKFTSDLFLENSFVLAEGRYDDAVFQVDAMGLPPIEVASESL